ncbi:MAG TPA: hypothetical protein VFR50_14905 [Casimicrobiaceae bacterium]|nr:hypothetical protein [Casimicrobiaceae bacterium]
MKQFVFTLTTGRSGTQYLAELLRQNLPDAECYHEICGWDRFGVDTPDLSHMTLFNSQGNVESVQAFTIASFRDRFDFWDTASRWLWYLDPDYPRNLVPSRELFAQGINGLCLRYILEIRARTARYERILANAPRFRVHRFGLEELRVPGGASRLLRLLGVATEPSQVRLPSPQNVGRLLVRIDPAKEQAIRRLIAAVGLGSPAGRQQRSSAALG